MHFKIIIRTIVLAIFMVATFSCNTKEKPKMVTKTVHKKKEPLNPYYAEYLRTRIEDCDSISKRYHVDVRQYSRDDIALDIELMKLRKLQNDSLDTVQYKKLDSQIVDKWKRKYLKQAELDYSILISGIYKNKATKYRKMLKNE